MPRRLVWNQICTPKVSRYLIIAVVDVVVVVNVVAFFVCVTFAIVESQPTPRDVKYSESFLKLRTATKKIKKSFLCLGRSPTDVCPFR